MIQYSLKCAEGHAFESWFKSADAFDRLAGAGMVACSVCGSSDVGKAVMAPRIGNGREEAPARPLSKPASEVERKLAELRRKIEANSEYVGPRFATEARAIHEGDAPERSIYGEARADEARKLLEDGVPVAPLPFGPTRKSN